MPLAYIAEEVAPELQQFYKQSDGKFVLDVDGVVPETQYKEAVTKVETLDGKLKEFRQNNISLKQQLETAGKQTVDVDALLEPRIAEMKTNYTSQIENLTNTNTALSQQLERVLLSDGVKEAAIKYGVLESALPDVISRARETFTVKDGTVVSKTKAKDKEGQDLNVNSWLTGLQEQASHLFNSSRGTGAQRPVSQHSNTPVRTAIDKIASGLAKT